MDKQHLEFVLSSYGVSVQRIKNSLRECGDNLEIFPLPRENLDKCENLRVNIYTQDPALVFDICAQFGKLKSVKVK